MRAIIVAAVSTTAQAADDRGSLGDQLMRCRETCAARGWTVVGEIVIPGHSRNYDWLHEIMAECPEYARLIRHITDRDADLIVVRDYDRLWRTDALRAQVTALCRQHRVQIYSINQPQEVVDPRFLSEVNDSRMILEALSGVLSEAENRTRTRRMMQGKRDRVERRGLPNFVETPFGYRRRPDGMFEPDPVTAPVVKWIFERRAYDRWGCSRIARALMEQGVAPPGNNNASGVWWDRTVRLILSNPFYVGHVRWADAYSEHGQHAPIISEDLWNQVQAINQFNAQRKARASRRGHRLLSGLARCGFCGYAMVYVSTGSGRRPGLGLRCSHYVATGGRACQGNWMRAEPIEQYVLDRVRRALLDADAWYQARGRRQINTDEIQQINAALDELDQRWQRWSRAYEIGAISLDELLLHRERITGERERYQQRHREIEALAQREAQARRVRDELAPLADSLFELDIPAQRRILHSLLAEVRCARGQQPELVWL